MKWNDCISWWIGQLLHSRTSLMFARFDFDVDWKTILWFIELSAGNILELGIFILNSFFFSFLSEVFSVESFRRLSPFACQPIPISMTLLFRLCAFYLPQLHALVRSPTSKFSRAKMAKTKDSIIRSTCSDEFPFDWTRRDFCTPKIKLTFNRKAMQSNSANKVIKEERNTRIYIVNIHSCWNENGKMAKRLSNW